MCGEYCAIAADIDANLNTFYFIKVGTTSSTQEQRCDAQRLKLVWSVCAWVKDSGNMNWRYNNTPWWTIEKAIGCLAHELFGASPLDYRPAGHTESYGRFSSAQEANNAAHLLFEKTKQYVKSNRKHYQGPIDFKMHPKALPVKAPKGLLNKVKFYCNPI